MRTRSDLRTTNFLTKERRNEYMVITISREFGSGGKYIGEQLAKNLNLKFYDKEIIERLSDVLILF